MQLVYKRNILKKTTLIRSTLPPASYKTYLDRSPPPTILSLHCKQINKVKNELDGQPYSFLISTHVLNYSARFPPAHSVFLELNQQTYINIQILKYLMKTTMKLSLYHSIYSY